MLANSAFVRPKQQEKASLPIQVTELGIVMDLSPLQS